MPVRSVERAIRILLLIAQSDRSLGVTAISREAGVDKATATRLLRTLELSELVRRDPLTRRYSPGSNAWRLANPWRNDLRATSRPHLEALRRDSDESVSLVCPRGLERVVVEVVAAPHELCVVPVIGTVHPIYSGASGKAIMAFIASDECQRIIELTGLKPVSPNSIADRATFLGVLDDVRTRGYAYSNGDVTIGASAIAAPVFDASAQLVGVVALRGPEVRMPPERVHQLAPRVVQTAAHISTDLGHSGNDQRCVS